ncbi:MAG: acyl-CoA dehydrogenase family protein [Rhizomicrobium sp.]
MEFGLTPDQKIMQESIGRTLERVCPLERVRKTTDGTARDVLAAVAELGVTGMLIPEEFGGLGLQLLDAALAAEMLGRHVAPVPFIASSVMAPLALLGAGNEAQQAKYLPKLASGTAIAGVAVSEHASGARDKAGIAAKAGKLSGKSLFVLDFAGAEFFIVADNFGALHIVDADAKGLERTTLNTIDATRAIGELNFDAVEAEPLSSGNRKRRWIA